MLAFLLHIHEINTRPIKTALSGFCAWNYVNLLKPKKKPIEYTKGVFTWLIQFSSHQWNPRQSSGNNSKKIVLNQQTQIQSKSLATNNPAIKHIAFKKGLKIHLQLSLAKGQKLVIDLWDSYNLSQNQP